MNSKDDFSSDYLISAVKTPVEKQVHHFHAIGYHKAITNRESADTKRLFEQKIDQLLDVEYLHGGSKLKKLRGIHPNFRTFRLNQNDRALCVYVPVNGFTILHIYHIATGKSSHNFNSNVFHFNHIEDEKNKMIAFFQQNPVLLDSLNKQLQIKSENSYSDEGRYDKQALTYSQKQKDYLNNADFYQQKILCGPSGTGKSFCLISEIRESYVESINEATTSLLIVPTNELQKRLQQEINDLDFPSKKLQALSYEQWLISILKPDSEDVEQKQSLDNGIKMIDLKSPEFRDEYLFFCDREKKTWVRKKFQGDFPIDGSLASMNRLQLIFNTQAGGNSDQEWEQYDQQYNKNQLDVIKQAFIFYLRFLEKATQDYEQGVTNTWLIDPMQFTIKATHLKKLSPEMLKQYQMAEWNIDETQCFNRTTFANLIAFALYANDTNAIIQDVLFDFVNWPTLLQDNHHFRNMLNQLPLRLVYSEEQSIRTLNNRLVIFIKSLFAHIFFCTLHDNERCPEKVKALLNDVEVKIEKFQKKKYIKLDTSDTSASTQTSSNRQGRAYWVNYADVQEKLNTSAYSEKGSIYIITLPEHVARLKSAFPKMVILTPEMAIGLDLQEVFVLDFFDNHLIKRLNELLHSQPYETAIQETQLASLHQLFSQLKLAIGRTTQGVYLNCDYSCIRALYSSLPIDQVTLNESEFESADENKIIKDIKAMLAMRLEESALTLYKSRPLPLSFEALKQQTQESSSTVTTAETPQTALDTSSIAVSLWCNGDLDFKKLRSLTDENGGKNLANILKTPMSSIMATQQKIKPSKKSKQQKNVHETKDTNKILLDVILAHPRKVPEFAETLLNKGALFRKGLFECFVTDDFKTYLRQHRKEGEFSGLFNSTSNTKSPDINSTSNTKSPGINSTSNTKSPGINSTSNTKSPGINSTSNTKSPDINSTSNTKSPDINSTSNTKSPGINSTSNAKNPHAFYNMDSLLLNLSQLVRRPEFKQYLFYKDVEKERDQICQKIEAIYSKESLQDQSVYQTIKNLVQETIQDIKLSNQLLVKRINTEEDYLNNTCLAHIQQDQKEDLEDLLKIYVALEPKKHVSSIMFLCIFIKKLALEPRKKAFYLQHISETVNRVLETTVNPVSATTVFNFNM